MLSEHFWVVKVLSQNAAPELCLAIITYVWDRWFPRSGEVSTLNDPLQTVIAYCDPFWQYFHALIANSMFAGISRPADNGALLTVISKRPPLEDFRFYSYEIMMLSPVRFAFLRIPFDQGSSVLRAFSRTKPALMYLIPSPHGCLFRSSATKHPWGER